MNIWTFGFKTESIFQQVSPHCGSCFTAKYRRHESIENLSPAKISIRSTLKWEDPTIIYFHAAQNNSKLRDGIESSDWSTWISEMHTGEKNSFLSPWIKFSWDYSLNFGMFILSIWSDFGQLNSRKLIWPQLKTNNLDID